MARSSNTLPLPTTQPPKLHFAIEQYSQYHSVFGTEAIPKQRLGPMSFVPAASAAAMLPKPPNPPRHLNEIPNELTLSVMEHIAINSPRDLCNLTTVYQPAYALYRSNLGIRLVQTIPGDPVAAKGKSRIALHHLHGLAEGEAELERCRAGTKSIKTASASTPVVYQMHTKACAPGLRPGVGDSKARLSRLSSG
ncbi:hypothetical protein LTR86_008315 [Recurvomyces mirabilis]|nr:hypothetical protein LTR86_008315 [Recurvomyces mirabilis]